MGESPVNGWGAVERGRLGLSGVGWRGRHRHRALGPGKRQDDEKPDEGEQDELREKKLGLHGVPPSSLG